MKIKIFATIAVFAVSLAIFSTLYLTKENNLKEEVCFKLNQYYNPWSTEDTHVVYIRNQCSVNMRFRITDTEDIVHSTECISPQQSDYTGYKTLDFIKNVTQSAC